MLILHADCSVTYTGRGDTTLERRRRAILVKDDGSVSIHADKGTKPLNYMGTPNTLSKSFDSFGNEVWSFDTRKESLQVTLHEVLSKVEFPLSDDEPGLVRDGTEDQLQAWLAERPLLFGEGYSLIQREYPTPVGPIDLLFQHEDGHVLVVEVKRVAMTAAVSQVMKYIDEVQEEFQNVRGMIAALDIRPRTLVQSQKKGIETMVVDWVR